MDHSAAAGSEQARAGQWGGDRRTVLHDDCSAAAARSAPLATCRCTPARCTATRCTSTACCTATCTVATCCRETSERDVMQRGEQHTCTNPHSPPSPNPNLSMGTSFPSMIHLHPRESAAQIFIYHNCQPLITPGCQSFVNPHNLTCLVPTQANNSIVTAFLDSESDGDGYIPMSNWSPPRDTAVPADRVAILQQLEATRHLQILCFRPTQYDFGLGFPWEGGAQHTRDRLADLALQLVRRHHPQAEIEAVMQTGESLVQQMDRNSAEVRQRRFLVTPPLQFPLQFA